MPVRYARELVLRLLGTTPIVVLGVLLTPSTPTARVPIRILELTRNSRKSLDFGELNQYLDLGLLSLHLPPSRLISTSAQLRALELQIEQDLCPDILLEFSFDGALPPVPGTNVWSYGMCHTTGGDFVEGTIYLDDGLSLVVVGLGVGQLLATTTAVLGNIVLDGDSIYSLTQIDPAVLWVNKSGGGGGGSGIDVYDEGVLVRAGAREMDFIGADVLANEGTPIRARVYIPPPVFLSHWNTADGSNGNQAVAESITRVITRIATPAGGEGTPFRTGGWAGTNQPTIRDNNVTFTTPGSTTGWGGDSTMTVRVLDADGLTILEQYTTPAIVANGVHLSPSGRISVTITDFGPDASRFRARANVWVNVDGVLSTAGLSGGRYHVEASHTTDSGTDGSGPYAYAQAAVFLDKDPFTPSVLSIDLTETLGQVLTKHLSGLEYYIINSQFTVDAQGIDHLNANTARTTGNLEIAGAEYGLPALSQSPFGAGAAFFSGWNNDHDNMGADYLKTDWAITAASYRLLSPSANISGYARDSWASGVSRASSNALVLIDTFASNSTALAEYFNDESWREDPTSFPGAGSWNSAGLLGAGHAQVWNGQIVVPNTATLVRPDGPATPNADWSAYQPNLGGPNPDYSLLGAPVDYGRRFTQAPGVWIPSFSMVFMGTFAAGDMLAELIAGNVEIYIYRVAGLGNIGPPPGNIFPLRVHLPFNFGVWDDGATLAGSGIREGSSAGNTINCTLGAGTAADTGLYCHIRIVNPATRIDSVVVTFF